MLMAFEALRLGAMIRPQVKYALFKDGGSCAGGAIMEAAGIVQYDGSAMFFVNMDRLMMTREMFPVLDMLVRGPEESDYFLKYTYPGSVWEHIVNMNNLYGWTRERIADWLEPIEREYWAKQRDTVAELVEVLSVPIWSHAERSLRS